ncbi:hypothetical protein KKH56_01690 [bacterium]|nr:hypothetical protein [bacterium]
MNIEGRRKLLSKTLMDIAKITIAAAFASEFFLKFSIGAKDKCLSIPIVDLVAAYFIYPAGGE